jgi:ER membrane protein complex subunit 4
MKQIWKKSIASGLDMAVNSNPMLFLLSLPLFGTTTTNRATSSKFQFDLNVREGHEGYGALVKCTLPHGYKNYLQKEHAITSLGGPTARGPTLTVAQQTALATRKSRAAMAIAMQPGQQILMQAFMLWMSGSQLNMFSISVTTMAILTPISSIFSLDRPFGHLQDVDLNMAKLIYVALNLAFLGLGLWKMSTMRLLPTTAADWKSKIEWKEMMEVTSPPPL